MKKLFDATVWKFLLVGVANTLVGSGVMFLLYNLAHVHYWVAVCANYVVGGILSFFLNKYFTFQNRERSAAQVLTSSSPWRCAPVWPTVWLGLRYAGHWRGTAKRSRKTWPCWQAWCCTPA